MFKIVNSTKYVLDKYNCERIWDKSSSHIDDISYGANISPETRSRFIKNEVCLMVATEVNNNIREVLIDIGFLTVVFTADETFNISVGYVNDQIVCGHLVL